MIYFLTMGILARITKIESLPTLPEIVARILKMVELSSTTVEQLSRVITQDPVLSATLLKIVNSAYYARHIGPRITSVNQAVTRLGLLEVRNIAVAMSLVRQFRKRANIISYSDFWRHALGAAFLNQHLLAHCSNQSLFSLAEKQSLFLTGLLHDLGILLYDQYFFDEFAALIDSAVLNEQSFVLAEQTLYPRETHAQICAALLEIWKFDPLVIAGVRYHHQVGRAPGNQKKMAAIMHCTEYLLCNNQVGSFEGCFVLEDESLWDFLGITRDVAVELVAKVNEDINQSDLVLILESGDTPDRLRRI